MVELNDLPSATWNPLCMRGGLPQIVSSAIAEPMVMGASRRITISPRIDLFHPLIPDLELDRVFAVMVACQMLGMGHRFTVTTQHAGRMHDYLTCDPTVLVERWAVAGDTDVRHAELRPRFSVALAQATVPRWSMSGPVQDARPFEALTDIFPLSNLAVGVFVTTQSEVDERVPRLNQARVAQRFVRATPREQLDFSYSALADQLGGRYPFSLEERYRTQRLHMLDWLSVGGPEGAERWSMDSEWVDSLMDDCKRAGIPFFFRGWGNRLQQEPARVRADVAELA